MRRYISLIHLLDTELCLVETGALLLLLTYFYEAHSSIFSSECVLECTDNVGLGSIILS